MGVGKTTHLIPAPGGASDVGEARAGLGSDRPTRFERKPGKKNASSPGDAPASVQVEAVATSAEPTFDFATGTVIAGKYRLERLLKAGGMGSVWVATHLTLDTAVAIKFMAIPEDDDGSQSKPDGEGVSRTRFEREAKMAAQLRSVNVVQILDYGVDRATAYIVMELLAGEGLDQRLRRCSRMSLEETAQLVVPVLQLLQRAHDARMVHRDLKPANIFIATDGDTEVPKVLDFGVAKAVGRSTTGGTRTNGGDLTSDQTLIGTPSYASPEQLRNSAKIDHRADLWSMGVVMFRMLTGRKPFKGGQIVEVIVEVCSGPIPTPTSVAPDLPRELDAFFERALSRDLDRRFQSAREMAKALTDLVASLDAGRWIPASEVEAVADESQPDKSAAAAVDGTPSAGSFVQPTRAGLSVGGARRPGWLVPALITVSLCVAVPFGWFALRSGSAPASSAAAATTNSSGTASVSTVAPLPPSPPDGITGTQLAATSGTSVPASASAVAPVPASKPRGPAGRPGSVAPPIVPDSKAKPRVPSADKEVGY